MKFKFLLLSFAAVVVLVASQKSIRYLYHFEEVKFSTQSNDTKNKAKNRPINKKNILLVNTQDRFFGGGEIHTISLFKNLLKQGYNVSLLVAKNSKLENRLKKLKLPYYSYRKFRILNNEFQPALSWAIYNICKKKVIDIVHSNIEREAKALKRIAQKLPIKIVATRHVPYPLKSKYIIGLDGLIGVSTQITEYLKKENFTQDFKIKEIVCIPPFFDDQIFLNLKTPQMTREEFFKKHFNIILKKIPVLCSVASIDEQKNQQLIIKAMAQLIHKKNKPVQVVFAGTGKDVNYLKNLSISLNIDDYVHFLGFTNKIPEVLYHSNIKILASKKEALGIALMEAALMKKPIIGVRNTGMEDIVKHKETGLLFENNNLDSLVEQIEKLLSDPELQKTLGENAYKFVTQNFSTRASIKKLIKFYEKVLCTSET